jgi:hypothetical protein
MTPAQHKAVEALKAEGFAVIVEGGDVVRVTRGADRRVIMADGTQKRGYHVEFKRTGQPAGRAV